MPAVLVRHGAVRYRVPRKGGQKGYSVKVAFRGMTVDMPADEVDRLSPTGAIVDPKDELPKNGTMLPLPNTASDEELIAWVSVASKDEIAAQIAALPHLGDRLLTARDIVKERLKEQNEILGGLDDIVEEGLGLAAEREAAEAKAAAESGVAPESGGESGSPKGDGDAANQGGDGTVADQAGDLDAVVAQSVPAVSDYLSEHPDQANAVLDAERVRADQPDAKPPHVREGVIKAVQAAAGFTAN